MTFEQIARELDRMNAEVSIFRFAAWPGSWHMKLSVGQGPASIVINLAGDSVVALMADALDRLRFVANAGMNLYPPGQPQDQELETDIPF